MTQTHPVPNPPLSAMTNQSLLVWLQGNRLSLSLNAKKAAKGVYVYEVVDPATNSVYGRSVDSQTAIRDAIRRFETYGPNPPAIPDPSVADELLEAFETDLDGEYAEGEWKPDYKAGIGNVLKKLAELAQGRGLYITSASVLLDWIEETSRSMTR